MAIGDFNGDGYLDLAVSSRGHNRVWVLLGTGAFGAATDFHGGGHVLLGVASADLNGDGKLDLVTTNAFYNTVGVLLGTETGAFGAAATFPVGLQPRSIAIGDLNGDGKVGLAVTNAASANVSILLGTGTGTFGAAINFPVRATPLSLNDLNFGTKITLGDLNGDGKPDLAVANGGSNTVSVLLNTSSSGSRPPTIANFQATPSRGIAPLPVAFTVVASDPDGTIASVHWEFDGDGIVDETTSTLTTSHTYTTAGGFTPSVTVVDNEGATASATTSVTVQTPADAITS